MWGRPASVCESSLNAPALPVLSQSMLGLLPKLILRAVGLLERLFASVVSYAVASRPVVLGTQWDDLLATLGHPRAEAQVVNLSGTPTYDTADLNQPTEVDACVALVFWRVVHLLLSPGYE